MPPPPGGSWTGIVAFAVDAAGRPHLVGTHGNGNVTWRTLDELGWHDVSVDTNLGSGVQVALALDPNGSPVVAYYEPTNRRLRYAELRGATFHIEEVSLTSPAGQNPSIAVDANGVRWIASNDGALGLRVAHGQSGSWTFESLGTSYSGSTQLAFGPNGILHLVWGSSRSLAVPSGAYSQPAAYHAARVAGTWQLDMISKQGLVFKRGLGFASNGDALVAYGVVSAVGQNDELRTRRFGATPSDVLVQSIGNWLNVNALGLYDTRADAKFIYPNASTLVRGAGEFWTTATHDLPPSRNLLDVVDGPDGRPRFLASLASNSPSNVNGYAFVTPPACVPSCTGATCGSDGCGGTCGTCSNGESCGPDDQCSPWLEETVNAPALTTYPSRSMSFAMTSTGAHHLLFRYNFPERYYTSGSTQDTLFHMTDATAPWQLPVVQTVVGIPMGSYAQLQIAPSSLQLGPTGPEAIYAYGLQGYTWSIRRASPGMEPWMTDWSNSAGQAHPRLVAVARNTAGVTYVITQCGYYGDVVCVDRRDSVGNTTATLSGDYVLAASAAVDTAGKVHILWTHMKRTNSVSTVTLEYATDASGTIVSTPITGETATSGSEVFRPMLALGPSDEVHIAFVHVGTTAVRHGVRNAGSFVIDDVPATGDLAFAVDRTGVPAILAADGTATLWRQNGGTWTSESIPTNGDASTPWIAFDAANKAHVVFEDGSSISRQLRLGWKP